MGHPAEVQLQAAAFLRKQGQMAHLGDACIRTSMELLDAPTLRIWTLPLKSPLLLACGKCQRRLKRKGDPRGLLPLKKLLKRIARRRGEEPPTVLKVPCLKLCPGNGLVVLTPAQLAEHQCSIVNTRHDVAALYTQLNSAG